MANLPPKTPTATGIWRLSIRSQKKQKWRYDTSPHVSLTERMRHFPIFYCAPGSRPWSGNRWISCPCFAQMHADFAGCRPSFTRESARNPHQHSVFDRSLRILVESRGGAVSSKGPVSTPPLIKPDVRISRIRLSDQGDFMFSPTGGCSWLIPIGLNRESYTDTRPNRNRNHDLVSYVSCITTGVAGVGRGRQLPDRLC